MNISASKARAALLSSAIILSLTATNTAHAICVAGSAGGDFLESTFQSNECVLYSGASVRYDPNCSENLSFLPWEVPLPANPGSHTVTISGTNTAGFMACGLCAITELHNITTTACTVNLVFPENTTSLQTGTINVPTNGHLWAHCQFPRGAGINTINYNQ